MRYQKCAKLTCNVVSIERSIAVSPIEVTGPAVVVVAAPQREIEHTREGVGRQPPFEPTGAAAIVAGVPLAQEA